MSIRPITFLRGIFELFDYDSDYSLGTLLQGKKVRSVHSDDELEIRALGRRAGTGIRGKCSMHVITVLGVMTKQVMTAHSISLSVALVSVVVGTLAYREIYFRNGKKRDWYFRGLFCFWNGYFWQSVIHDVGVAPGP